LIDVDDSILLVIDVQDAFLERLPAYEHELLVNRITWLISVASELGVPIVAMAENVPEQGSLAPEIAARMPHGTQIHSKMVFGLAGDDKIVAEVRKTGRGTAILVGLETDVCVAHSALGLLRQGFEVVALVDATASPGSGHEIGLERMRRGGVLLSSVKSLYYEWVRTVENDDALRERLGSEFPPPRGVVL
jgi:nicotinamidase-related amidase